MGSVGKNLKGLEEQAGTSIGNIDSMVKNLGAGLTTMAIGVGGLAASYGLAGKAGEFEQALAAVGAVSNASAEDLKLLREAAIKAGKETQFSPTAAVLGLNELAQAGYSAKESIDLLRPSLDLASGSLGELSPQEAAGLASQALKAFGIDASLAGRAVDQMLQSANMFSVRASDLPLGLGTASRGAQVLNQSLTETVIAFGLVKNVIPGTERAATAVASAMERMAKPEVQKALRSQHVAVVDANGGYRQFLDIIKDLMPALDKMTEGQRGSFLVKTFGADALGSINAIMTQFQTGVKGADGAVRKGGEAIEYLRGQFRGANGVAEDFSKKMLNTFEGSKILLMGSMETLAIGLGDPFKDMFRPVIEATTTAVNSLIDVIEGMSPGAKALIAEVIVGTFATMALLGAFLTITAAWPLIVGGVTLVTGALGTLAASAGAALLALWPLALAGVVIGAVAYAVNKNLGGMGDTWDRIVDSFSGGAAVIKSVFDAVVAYVSPLWDALKDGFSETFATFGPVFASLSNALETLMDAFRDLGTSLGMTMSGPGQQTLSFFKFLGGAIADLLRVLVNIVSGFVLFGAMVVQVFSGVASIVKPIIQGLIDGLSFWVDKITWLVDKISGAWELIKAIASTPSALATGFKTTSGDRGMPVDHSTDVIGRASTRGLGPTAVVPETFSLRDQGLAKEANLSNAQQLSEAQVAGLADQDAGRINYEKLAAAVAKQPIQVNIDGEKLAIAIARGDRSAAARRSGADLEED